MFLQAEGVVPNGFMITVCVIFTVEAFDVLGGTIVAISIEMGRNKGDTSFCQIVAFGQNGSLGGLFLGA
jgi:hypothetical protein